MNMSKSTQKAQFRKALVLYAKKHGVTKAAMRYNTNRQYVYRWLERYDGTLDSLMDRSHCPHSHPNAHTAKELQLINDMRKKDPHSGLIVFWVKLTQCGYTRSITGLYRVLQREGKMSIKLPNPKYIQKEYEQMEYPGERVQIDVKLVPDACVPMGVRFYQYTAIDEYTRYRYLEAFQAQNNATSAVFLEHVLRAFPFPIRCVQTDNGVEFASLTKQETPTPFETCLQAHGITHKFIKHCTPRHNGKVERSHRKDNEYFYAMRRFSSFVDFSVQLAEYNIQYNDFPMRPLGWKSPCATLLEALA